MQQQQQQLLLRQLQALPLQDPSTQGDSIMHLKLTGKQGVLTKAAPDHNSNTSRPAPPLKQHLDTQSAGGSLLLQLQHHQMLLRQQQQTDLQVAAALQGVAPTLPLQQNQPPLLLLVVPL